MATKYELSKTYQYRKVMKPLLERKRRARINDCLDDLKELMVECMQLQSGDPTVKLDKVDILELTVQHMRKLKAERRRQTTCRIGGIQQNSFRGGYIKAANEVSRCLASMPNVDVSFGTQLMTHLGLRLNQLECAEEAQTTVHKPLSISVHANCSAFPRHSAMTTTPSTPTSMCSPVSSGYASDSDSSRSSPAPLSNSNQTLLQVVSPVWRPW